MGHVTLADIEEAAAKARPPLSAKEWVDEMAAQGVTFWLDVTDGVIKAKCFAAPILPREV
jgi:hypothetical protein